MAQVLELAELPQGDGVTQMDIRSRWVHPQLDVQRYIPLELPQQRIFGNDLGGARADDMELFFGCEHGLFLLIGCSDGF